MEGIKSCLFVIILNVYRLISLNKLVSQVVLKIYTHLYALQKMYLKWQIGVEKSASGKEITRQMQRRKQERQNSRQAGFKVRGISKMKRSITKGRVLGEIYKL